MDTARLSPVEKAAVFVALMHCVIGDDPLSVPQEVTDTAETILQELTTRIDHGMPPVLHPWIAEIAEDQAEALAAALTASERDVHAPIDTLSAGGHAFLKILLDSLNFDEEVGIGMAIHEPEHPGLPGL